MLWGNHQRAAAPSLVFLRQPAKRRGEGRRRRECERVRYVEVMEVAGWLAGCSHVDWLAYLAIMLSYSVHPASAFYLTEP